MSNLTAGIGDSYWYEWSVGLLYMVKMLNSDNEIKHVVLQAGDSQCLDDVVITYESGMVEYIQVKHTREEDKISYSDMIEGGIEESYLHRYSVEWKKKEIENSGKNRVIFFSNRKMGNTKYTPNGKWERPPLSTFWTTIKSQVNALKDNSEADIDLIIVKKEWEDAWNEWKKCMGNLDAKEQLNFLQNFDIVSSQEELGEMINMIAYELEKRFSASHEKAVELHQKLCYQLMWWSTTIGDKKEIGKEDVMRALSLSGDEIKGSHQFPICEPFFESRISFVNDLENIILEGKSRIIFLTGNPGCGKTNIVSYLSCKPESIVTVRFYTFRPIMPGDMYVSADHGISDPIDFWGSLLIMFRNLFKGRLYEHNVPISIELINSVDVLRSEVLRLASAWAQIVEKPTVIVVDGVDHAARSGSNNTFLKTLPTPESIPDNVRFLLVGQPTYQFDEYPDFLSDPDRVEEVEVPNIQRSDLELLYEKNNCLMKYSEYDKKLVITYIEDIAKGSTLSAVFAMEEASKYDTFSDFEINSNVKKLSSGIQSYYEYIWKTAIQQVEGFGHLIDMYLSASFSIINRKITAQTMSEIYEDGISVYQWEEFMQNLFPIITYDKLGYGVFHNDVRIFLVSHYKKAKQLLPGISSKMARFLMNNNFDERIKHEVIFSLLKSAGEEEKYVDVFNCKYVINAYLLKRDLREIQQQMQQTLEILPRLEDKRKIILFSCAVTTMQQHKESLRWLDREYQSEVEIPFALESEKKPVADELISINYFNQIFYDIGILIEKNEIIRAKGVLSRWMHKRILGKFSERFGLEADNEEIATIIEKWGVYARKLDMVPQVSESEDEAEKREIAYFYRGWLKESVNYSGIEQLKITINALKYYFPMDLEEYLQQIIKCGQTEELVFLLQGKTKKMFSARNKAAICAWAVWNNGFALCTGWLQEIKSKMFVFVPEEWFKKKYNEIEVKRERFKVIADLMYVLSFISDKKGMELREQAIAESKIGENESDNVVASNLLLAVNQIAFMQQCILCDCIEKIELEDFEALIEIIINDKYYNGCFSIDTNSFRKKIITCILDMIDELPCSFQNSLENTLCIEAKTYSQITLFEAYWKFLLRKGKCNIIEEYFDAWMNYNGKIWKEELYDRDYISNVLLQIAEEMNWQEKINQATMLLNVRSIGYVGRKDYSLFAPMSWLQRVGKECKEIWKDMGVLLMNISEYASEIGDNRAAIQIRSAVSEIAVKSGIDSFYQFIKMMKNANQDWIENLFNGVICALEDDSFTREEINILWEKTVYYFSINEQAKPYDSQNTRNKIYCADVHQAISLCINRLGYDGIEKSMEQMAPREYAQKRLGKSEHSCIIPTRWYESEFSPNEDLFIEKVKKMNIDEMFEYIEKIYGEKDFSWDYLKYFIQKAESSNCQSIYKYKYQIMKMLMERKVETLDYDGVNRLYNVLFPYMTEVEITGVLNKVLETYYCYLNDGWSSADFGLMTDLENFCFALFTRFGTEDNKWALQEILKMHCMWLNGTENLEMENIYQVEEVEHIEGWQEFWQRIC